MEARWEAAVLREWGEVGGAGRTSMKEEVPDCATVPSWLIRSSLDMPAHAHGSQGRGEVKVGEGGRPAASGCGCVWGGPPS